MHKCEGWSNCEDICSTSSDCGVCGSVFVTKDDPQITIHFVNEQSSNPIQSMFMISEEEEGYISGSNLVPGSSLALNESLHVVANSPCTKVTLQLSII
jgi:hypothetical protein